MTNTATPLTTTDAQRLFDTHTAAWNAGDAAGMAATYERDGRLLDPFGGLADGTQIIDGATAPDGTRLPELALHFTAILRRTDGDLGILECRPYAFLPAG